ncbi:uncharacterized protein [Ptychodera flava]|uniref:uncharacterized protein n=1 Tax=Ptychodera flava TaxID=63121 RepID=UPI003969EE1B
MIEVDIFWSFAMGACFAACASEALKREHSALVNKYFIYCVLYLSLVFAPSGVYLLWGYTGWETMFFFDRSLHPIWPCLFACTNVSQGVLGFILVCKLVHNGKEATAHAVWTMSYTCMFAILTLGYDRFLYAGTLEEWRAGKKYPLTDFFYCEVFYTLLVMAIFVLPPLFYAMSIWPTDVAINKQRKWTMIKQAATGYLYASIAVVVGFLLLYGMKQMPNTWGYDRLLAFLIGQVIFGIVLFLPLLFIPLKRNKIRKIK